MLQPLALCNHNLDGNGVGLFMSIPDTAHEPATNLNRFSASQVLPFLISFQNRVDVGGVQRALEDIANSGVVCSYLFFKREGVSLL